MSKNIKHKLNDMKEGENITFDRQMFDPNISENDYLLAIRSSRNCPTIFLKRSPNELRINKYNAACLSAWRANMDIQFVLDVYPCAIYIVSYIYLKFKKELVNYYVMHVLKHEKEMLVFSKKSET